MKAWIETTLRELKAELIAAQARLNEATINYDLAEAEKNRAVDNLNKVSSLLSRFENFARVLPEGGAS